MFDSGSITPLPLDPVQLEAFIDSLPAEVVEQFTNNWRTENEAPERSPKENRLLHLLLRQLRIKKYGPFSEGLSDEQLELLEQEPGVSQPELEAESQLARLELPLKRDKQLPARIIEKSLGSDRLIVETIVGKYADHRPLYRQSSILERDTGMELSPATLYSWVMRVGELLGPIKAAMARELLAGDYLQADETPVDVQGREVKGKNHQACLWQYSRPKGVVVFDFQLSCGREGPKGFLGDFNGILQSDGYSGYDRVGGPRLVHAGCWAHARRYFFQAVEAQPEDEAAIGLVAAIDELFGVDALAREQHLNFDQRDELRQQRTRSILESIKSRIEAAKTKNLPKSALAKACNYTLTFWNRLTRFLDHPILELSNNSAENAMRPNAPEHKNWIHFGNKDAGPRIAAILSIVETCRRMEINMRDYLGSILPGLSNLPVSRAAELTPSTWFARQ